MNTLAIKFDPTGRGHCLYTEVLDLTALGTLDIQRAATIEFHNGRQQWEVRDATGTVLHSDSSRAACLLWEQQYFNR